MSKILLYITICLLNFLLLSKISYCQNSLKCKKWAFTITILPQSNSDSAEPDLYRLFQSHLNSQNMKMSLYFNFISFEDSGKLYLNCSYDSASALLLMAGINEANLKAQDASLQIDFASGTLSGDSIYKLDDKITFIKDTVVNHEKVYLYHYKDYKFFSKAKISSIGKNFMSATSKFIELFKDNIIYSIELIDNNYKCDNTEIVKMFRFSTLKPSNKNIGIVEYFIFNK